MSKHATRIPIMGLGGTIPSPSGKLGKILSCVLEEADGAVSKTYCAVRTATPDGMPEYIGIYVKGKHQSNLVAGVLLNIESGQYMVNVPNPMTRPAGLDLVITFSVIEEAQCAA